ncbi:hypothetical protein EI545_10920 [Tabrizicola piscis]|uniref:DUF4304 domain-containing protein n=1 Tax=Tabrizicola piscis TaxID=2494374 RepID=A0A3S8U6U2_9RHOB|nr:hypothetical protein [Tabrizicola piscis]AZL59313.1 hypothetical protein EI545_10920 [Tabrizicola piscis]
MTDPLDEDLAARKYTAAHDPAFPQQREAAYQAIVAALDAALVPQGYGLKGSTWTRVSPAGKSAVHLQRSRYGWEVQIVLRFLTPEGDPPDHPDWDDGEDMTLVRFGGGGGEDPGRLAFLDVLEKPAQLDRTIDILLAEALPWLESLHDPQP